MAEPIKYRTLFPRDLAKSVMFEGGWSSLLVLFAPLLRELFVFMFSLSHLLVISAI